MPLLGWLARDPSVLRRVGHVLLQLASVEPKRTRCFVIADDLFQLCKVPKQKTMYVVSKVIEKLSGCKLQVALSFFLLIYKYYNSSMQSFGWQMLVLSTPFVSLIFLVFAQTSHRNIWTLGSILHQTYPAWKVSVKNQPTSKMGCLPWRLSLLWCFFFKGHAHAILWRASLFSY